MNFKLLLLFICLFSLNLSAVANSNQIADNQEIQTFQSDDDDEMTTSPTITDEDEVDEESSSED